MNRKLACVVLMLVIGLITTLSGGCKLSSPVDLRQAAEKGDASAQFALGECYLKGIGVPQSYTEAASWYRKAAEQGHVKAQFNLGACYLESVGVQQDEVAAYMWFNLAAANGHSVACEQRDLLAKRLKPEQLAEGQKLSVEFAAKKPAAAKK